MYIFTSKRLGFRDWKASDAPKLHTINSDKEVMEFFPSFPSKEDTIDFVKRMQFQFKTKGYCYFATDCLDTKEFIGFIGLSYQTYKAPFTPYIDIGWRIEKKHWNKGFATEGAKACLNYAFENLKVESIYAIAPKINKKSEAIMRKIGMQKIVEFKHPKLAENKLLEECIVYKIE